MEKRTDSKLGKKYVKAVYCYPAYLTYMQSTLHKWGLDESQAGIKIARINTINLTCADDTTLTADNKEKLKSLPLDEGERGEWKAGLKPNIQKINIMGIWSHHSWQTEGEKVEAVTDFIFLGSKITEDSDSSHEIKRHLLLGRKAMANLDSILKSRDIILLTKICLVKALFFPVVMYGCKSWP